MKLVIESAKLEYTGTYKVVVSNESGKDESSAKLTVEVFFITRYCHNFYVKLVTSFLITIYVSTNVNSVVHYKFYTVSDNSFNVFVSLFWYCLIYPKVFFLSSL